VAYAQERHARSKADAVRQVGKQGRELQRRHKGVTKLLERCCDAVIAVDTNFQILEDSPKLRALLLRCPNQSLVGVNFRSCLFSEEEAEKLDDHMFDMTETDTGAGMLKVRLKDSNSKPVYVHIYHTRLDFDTDVQFLIGVEEVGEEATAAQGQADVIGPLPEDSHSGPGSGAPSVCSKPETCAQADIRMTLEMQTMFMDMEFVLTFGTKTKGCSFKEWLVDADAFVEWLMVQRADLLEGMANLPQVRHFGRIRIMSSENEETEKFLSVYLPDAVTQRSMDVKQLIQAGKYRVSLRLYSTSGRWAAEAQREELADQSAEAHSAGTPSVLQLSNDSFLPEHVPTIARL